MEEFENVFQIPFSVVEQIPFDMQGRWGEMYFGNDNPIILELGCGKGEYTTALARMFPDKNFIGVDIKGARMWTGAKEALEEGLHNVAFLRTNIEIIDRFFGEDEVSEIWLTFSDPQMKKTNKRLTSTNFLNRYRKFLVDGGAINVKTDSNFLFTYTKALTELNGIKVGCMTDDLYRDITTFTPEQAAILNIHTYYEQMWLDRGITIKFIRLHLPKDIVLTEPDIEIEPDTYRSYGRNKR